MTQAYRGSVGGRCGQGPGRSAGGFTLIELIVTVVMASVLIAIAVPNFSSLIKNNRLAVSANDLLAALQLARSEAVKRKEVMTLCASSESVSSDDPGCTASTDWTDGWILFVDADDDGLRTTGAGSPELLIEVGEGTAGRGLTAVGAGAVAASVRFGRNGTASAGGTISICDDQGVPRSRAVKIEQYTGRTYIQEGAGACP